MNGLAYITADSVASETGGGVVTKNESQALKELGDCQVYARNGGDYKIECMGNIDPWGWDEQLCVTDLQRPKLAHFYSGTFSKTIDILKAYGSKIVYTAAAHSIEKSRKAHEDAGFKYEYPHLTNPDLWKRYISGYLAADIVICPSKHSADCMRDFGCKRIEIIPHGIDLPETESIRPLPKTFTCGYMGSYGPDKGVKYLLQAWGKLNYKDAVLVLAGRDSNSLYVQQLINQYAGHASVVMTGWVKNVADFYNSISLYIQSSLTEGFGIEVLEAMAYKRSVICSRDAGAVDVVPHEDYQEFSHDEPDFLVSQIDYLKQHQEELNALGYDNREAAEIYTWSKIRTRYQEVWKGLLNG